MTQIMVPISPGELIDKLTILALKADKITDPAKLANVRAEQDVLSPIAAVAVPEQPEIRALWDQLHAINAELWVIEDDIRACEAAGDFGPEFVRLARAVYRTNDRRAAVKKDINIALGSAIVEEKSYVSPDGAP